MRKNKNIIIVGGGAAGFFAAISAAQAAKDQEIPVNITLMEGSSRFLQKVKISGGGRCNVTYHEFSIREFVTRYPRGQKELISPMHQFQAKDMVAWFEDRGVPLKTESDGRMFPVTDSSQTVIDCLIDEATGLGVQTDLRFQVQRIELHENGFSVYHDSTTRQADAVLLATGSSPLGYQMAEQLGHGLTQRAPSLFSFKIPEPDLCELQGTAFEHAKVTLTLPLQTYVQEGPLLITHWGLSGPVILKLSAWAAREMMHEAYQGKIEVNWTDQSKQSVIQELTALAQNHPKATMQKHRLRQTTQRFWQYVLQKSKVDPSQQWAQLSKNQTQAIANVFTQQGYQIKGKNRFKDEFVECGGVDLLEIDIKTMQSKKIPGLYFAGEIMDVDGLTGGFNLQHAWTSGYIAGRNMVLR